jgi:hypothetical protein
MPYDYVVRVGRGVREGENYGCEGWKRLKGRGATSPFFKHVNTSKRKEWLNGEEVIVLRNNEKARV